MGDGAGAQHHHAGMQALARKMLGFSHATLYRKLKCCNITTRGTDEREEAPETEALAAGH
jgi:DNA-binding NtrC family response regulator